MFRGKDYEFIKYSFLKEFVKDSTTKIKCNGKTQSISSMIINRAEEHGTRFMEFFGYDKQMPQKNIVDEAQIYYRKEEYNAILEILRAMGVSKEKIFDVHKLEDVSLNDLKGPEYYNPKYGIEGLMPIESFSKGSNIFKKIIILNDSIVGDIRICYIKYENRNDNEISRLWIPASYKFGHPTIGLNRIPAICLNRSSISKYEDKTIIFFCSSEIALEWCLIDKQFSFSDKSTYIVSGIFDDRNPENVDFPGALFARRVILVPSPNDQKLKQVEKIIEKLDGNVELYIYPWLVVEETNICDNYHGNSVMHIRCQKVDSFSDLQNPNELLEKIDRESLPLKEYHKWRISKQASNDLIVSVPDEVRLIPLRDLVNNLSIKGDSLSWDGLLSQASYVMLWGPTNSYKTHLTAKIVTGLVDARNVLGLNVNFSHRVAYFDGENDYNRFFDIIRRVGGCTNLNQIFYLRSDMNLLNRQDEIIKSLEKEKIDIVIVDNISSLIPEATRGNAKFFNGFREELRRRNIALFLVHHANKSGNIRGDNSLGNLCSTILYVNEIKLDNLENINPEYKIREYLNKGSILLQLLVKKWKKGHYHPQLILEHNEEQNSLELLFGSWINNTRNNTNHSEDSSKHDNQFEEAFNYDKTNIQSLNKIQKNTDLNNAHEIEDSEINPKLKEYELKIIEYVKKNDKISNHEVCILTGCSSSTATTRLKVLVNKNLLKKKGNGRTTHYVLVNNHPRSVIHEA